MKNGFVFFTLLTMITCIHATERQELLIQHVQNSILRAEQHQSQLPEPILNLPGMSSPKVRHLLNQLCSLEGASYLEIGCWKGSTLISALYGNQTAIHDAIAIDNWAEFDGPKEEFLANTRRWLTPQSFRFLETDCFAIQKQQIFHHPVTIYFYDGNHETHSQEMAFTFFDDIFEHTFIAVIDDWNAPSVKAGTGDAFKKLGYRILYERVLDARFNGDTEMWWNGIYIAVIQKP